MKSEIVVYIVFVKELKNPKAQYWIAMFPRSIYQINDPSDWYKADPDMKLQPQVK
jgi:hypothetical protein